MLPELVSKRVELGKRGIEVNEVDEQGSSIDVRRVRRSTLRRGERLGSGACELTKGVIAMVRVG